MENLYFNELGFETDTGVKIKTFNIFVYNVNKEIAISTLTWVRRVSLLLFDQVTEFDGICIVI